MWRLVELDLLANLGKTLEAGFSHLPEVTTSISSAEESALLELAGRLHQNDPYHHPLYCGQMLKPPHPVARLAYALAMELNPNNHALDGGRATAAMEREAVDNLALMTGWTPPWLGHLCGGGTMANFEALWVTRETTGGRGVAVSSQAHYTHSRLSAVLQVPCHQVRVDRFARMDLEHLEQLLRSGLIGTVVATLGTTGLGAVDPLADIVRLQEKYPFRLHVDAAYGGYFGLCPGLDQEARRHFVAISHADSFAIDPHKHGLQPYGCGCILFRDPAVAKHYLHDSPYTYYTSSELHLGEISLECSRAGAAAAALWATQQALPMTQDGEFAAGLGLGLQAARKMHDWLALQPEFVPIVRPELDIVVWAVRGASASQASRRARDLFESARQRHLYLALITLPQTLVEPTGAIAEWDQPQVTCLRSVLMKPEHLVWLPEIQRLLRASLNDLTTA